MQAGALNTKLLADISDVQAKMAMVERLVGSTFGSIESTAKRMAGSLAAAFSIGAMTVWIRGAIDVADATQKLSQKIGVATHDIAGLQLAYKLAGLESGAMQTSISKLSKGLVENNKGLEALGIRTKETGGAFRSTKAVLYDVADQIAKMPDGLQKTAIAVEIFGRAGADMIPLLNGGAAGMREMDEMAQKLGLTIDEKTGKAAEQFNDTMSLLGMGTQGVGRQIAAQLLPTLQSLAGAFLESMTSGDKLKLTADILAGALKGLYIAAASALQVFSSLGMVWSRVIGAVVLATRGDFSGAMAELRVMVTDVKADWSAFGTSMGKVWNDEAGAAVAAAAKTMGAQKDLLAAAKAREEAAKKAAKEYEQALKQAVDFLATLKQETRQVGLSADQIKMMAAARAAAKAPTEALRKAIMEEALALLQAKTAQDAVTAAQKEAMEEAKERQKLRQAESDQIDAYLREESARLAAAVKGSQDALQAAKDELAQRGMLKSQIAEITLLRLQDQLVNKNAGSEAYEALVKQIGAQRELIEVLRGGELLDANEKAAKAAEDQWKQVADSFVDNLMRGGKSVAQYLKDLFRTLVLRPILAPVGQAVAGVVGSALGMPAAAQGAGGSLVGSAAGSWLGSTIAGGSFLSGISGASAAMAGGTTFGVTGAIGGHAAAMGVGGTGLAGAAGSLGAGVSSALAAIPAWGWAAMAAMAIASLAKGGETRSGGKYTGLDFIEGPSGGEINADATRTAIGATQAGIAQLLKDLGATATLSELQSGFEQSERGKGFAYAGGTLSTGASFGQMHGDGWQNRRGSMTPEQAAAAFGEELKQATLQALQAADVPGQLGEYLRSLGDIDALSGGALDAALARINKALSEKATLEEQIFNLTHTELEILNAARDKERAAIDESNLALLEHVYALQDQKTAAEAAAQAERELAQQREEAERELAQQREEVARERYGLETRLLQLQGNTAELRRRELEALDPSNRALQEAIWELEGMAAAAQSAAAAAEAFRQGLTSSTDDAFSILQRVVSRQRDALQVTANLAQEQVSSIAGVFGLLRDQVRSLYQETVPEMAAAAGRQFIDQALSAALSTGYLPQQDELAAAIGAVRGGMDAGKYASAFEFQRDRLVLASKLSQLQGVSGTQLTVAERQLQAAKDQIGQLDQLLVGARDQIDALRGVDTSVLSVRDVLERIAVAMSREAVGTGVKLGTTEQWVTTPVGQVWQSTGGALGVNTAGGIQIAGNQTNFTASAAQQWVNAQLAASDPTAVYQRAQAEGISANSLDALMGWSAGTSNDWARNVGLPTFASGGWHAGGARIVGELGPELEVTGPSRIFNAQDTSRILGGGDPEVAKLLRENQRMYLEMIQRLQNMDARLKKFDKVGLPPTRTTA